MSDMDIPDGAQHSDRPKRSEEPLERLTRICDAMTVTLTNHPENPDEEVKAIIMLQDEKRGGLVMVGYEDDMDAMVDLLMHIRAVFRANGKDLSIIPMDTPRPGMNIEVSGVVNPGPNWGEEGVITSRMVLEMAPGPAFRPDIESVHSILRRLAELGVPADFVDDIYLEVHFPGHTELVMPGDTLIVYKSMGPDD